MTGVCTAIHKSAGTVLPDDPFNCSKSVCDGNGNLKTEADPDDHLGSDSCVSRYCDGTNVVEDPINQGGNCAFGGGKCCNGNCCIAAIGCCNNGLSCDFGNGVCL